MAARSRGLEKSSHVTVQVCHSQCKYINLVYCIESKRRNLPFRGEILTNCMRFICWAKGIGHCVQYLFCLNIHPKINLLCSKVLYSFNRATASRSGQCKKMLFSSKEPAFAYHIMKADFIWLFSILFIIEKASSPKCRNHPRRKRGILGWFDDHLGR